MTWIPELGIHYKLGVDGLNLFLIAMTALLWLAATAWALLPAQSAGRPRPRLFYLMLALGETAVLGAFCAQDLALFVLFFDLMLVPFYFLIGIWGGPGPRAGDDHVRDLHAGREPADARRRGRDRHPRDAGRRPGDVRAHRS